MRDILKTAGRLIPRSLRWRIGRMLYMDARGDVPNDMATNGELFLQECVVRAWLRRRSSGARFVAFDIGANRGDWIRELFARIPTDGHETDVTVVAFEPDPVAMDHLKKHFAQERRVTFEQIALSSESGTRKFYLFGPATGTNSLHVSGVRPEKTIEVRTETLDNYCTRHDIERVDLVKCDAEGDDGNVISGAAGMLAAGAISVFQFEYNHRWVFARKFLKDVFEAIAGLSYKLAKLQPDHVIVFDDWHFELERYFEGNYALLHQRAMDWMPLFVARWNSSNTMIVAR